MGRGRERAAREKGADVGIFESVRNTLDDAIDTDRDGAYLDNLAEGWTSVGPAIGGGLAGLAGGLTTAPAAGPAAPAVPVAGLVAGATAATSVAKETLGRPAHAWGDEISDFMGTRDQSARNAGEHGSGIGGTSATRSAPARPQTGAPRSDRYSACSADRSR
jgi:hypothetical protein